MSKYKTLREAESAIEDYKQETMSKFSIYRKDKEFGAEVIHYFETKIFRQKTIENFTCMYVCMYIYIYTYIYIYIIYILYIYYIYYIYNISYSSEKTIST